MTDNTNEDVVNDVETTATDPRLMAHAVAFEVADDDSQVGDFLGVQELEDGVSDFRFAAHIPGYEGWQWSVMLYHDEDRGLWTVSESSLIPGEDSLMPPQWIPWKDRLLPSDLAVTDALGTEPDDPRLEDGFNSEKEEADSSDETATASSESSSESDAKTDSEQTAESSTTVEAPTETEDKDEEKTGHDEPLESKVHVANEFELSRRRVLTPLGRAQAAERWYSGPHGPKSLSTKTADGLACQTCGFFIPLQGELNLMFGVCANKWSPDDGRVVSRDHGCGEHSEIEPPEPSSLWIQSKPAYDDMHIDIVEQAPREERGDVEAMEAAEGADTGTFDDNGHYLGMRNGRTIVFLSQMPERSK
ncbi:DUF3027 domain-containing protein [Bifidobacterium vansinderenii]|uniref:DUF3027 domain-containing protein n=1 Tax=Bifidobacterium vansinderenii TaxID=1984871 RepID=A0A229W128_9BIFI|nr:DUF3027 domain-containing protein [Bifidobacterium vansinderenii]OXN01552.1 hypothetical protein Tam10B_0187 [Bifidobacterium vansinderenii]